MGVFEEIHGDLRIRQADHRAAVTAPNMQDAALGIREAADPTNELIPPSLLPFQTLVFLHTGSSLMTGLMTDWGRGAKREARVSSASAARIYPFASSPDNPT